MTSGKKVAWFGRIDIRLKIADIRFLKLFEGREAYGIDVRKAGRLGLGGLIYDCRLQIADF